LKLLIAKKAFRKFIKWIHAKQLEAPHLMKKKAVSAVLISNTLDPFDRTDSFLVDSAKQPIQTNHVDRNIFKDAV